MLDSFASKTIFLLGTGIETGSWDPTLSTIRSVHAAVNCMHECLDPGRPERERIEIANSFFVTIVQLRRTFHRLNAEARVSDEQRQAFG